VHHLVRLGRFRWRELHVVVCDVFELTRARLLECDARLARAHAGRLEVHVLHAERRAVVDQHADRLGVLVCHGVVKRRLVLLVVRHHIGLVGEQCGADGVVAEEGGNMERRHVGEVERLERRALIDQLLGEVRVAEARCVVQRCLAEVVAQPRIGSL
jgi:hypothetical protein